MGVVEGCEGWVVLVKEVGLGVGSGVGGAPVVDIGLAGLGAGSKLSKCCRPYLSFTACFFFNVRTLIIY